MKMHLLLLLMLGVWIGMLIGISFLEAPLKFRAPNITLSLGLGIGKLVFSALNKFEIVFSIALLSYVSLNYKALESMLLVAVVLILIIVGIQTLYLLPALIQRADLFIGGKEVAKSYDHLYYVAFELLKLVLLVYGFIKMYRHGGYSG